LQGFAILSEILQLFVSNSVVFATTMEFNPELYYRLERISQTQWRFGPVRKIRFRLVLINPLPVLDTMMLQHRIHQVLSHAFSSMLANTPESATAQLVIVHELFRRGAIASEKGPASELKFEQVSKRLADAVQSEEAIDLTDLEFYLHIYEPVDPYRNRDLRRS
jgi:hypothetical protein